ncbi:MAG: ribonuclease E inhibitor RraB [Gaiellaceae bacterium]
MSKDDRIAIEALVARAGARCPRWFRHFIYVPDRAKAEALAAKLRLDGLEVESRVGADNVNWLVLVRHRLVPDEEAVERLREQLTDLAEVIGGEYDEWEGEVGDG